jgi:hypothetical protein
MDIQKKKKSEELNEKSNEFIMKIYLFSGLVEPLKSFIFKRRVNSSTCNCTTKIKFSQINKYKTITNKDRFFVAGLSYL